MEGEEEEAAIVKNGEVEVTSEEEGFKGAWYKAILQDSPSKSGQKSLTVRYLTLLNDDGLSPLTETIDQSFIRPVPPENLYNDVVFEEGVLVDADYKDGWWMGVVLKKLEEDEKFLVYFDSPPDVIEFEKKQLRVHLDWNGWKWFQPEITELDKSEFSSGTMIEVSSIIEKGEIIWFPAMVIKEISKEKKFIVKDINKHLSYNGEETRPNVTIDSRRVRPKPPLVEEEEEFELMECVEVFHCSIWRQGLIKGVLSEKRYLISLGTTTREEYEFQHSDLRPVMVWENGVWHNKPKQNTGNKKVTRGSSSAKTAKLMKKCLNLEDNSAKVTSIEPVTPSLVITSTPLKETETEGKKSPEKMMLEEEIHEEDTSRKRKREEEQEHNNSKTDEIMVLPFEKKSPYWKKCESSKRFKSSPQAPHFNPLLEMKESIREWSAVGMMVSFYGLLDEVQELKLDESVERLNFLIESFAELEKHGFDVVMVQSRIKKVLALKDERAKKAEERKCVEEKIEEGEIEKCKVEEELVEIEREMLELKRREAVAKEKKEGVEREISEMKLNVGKIVEEIEDVEVEVKRIVSASW